MKKLIIIFILIAIGIISYKYIYKNHRDIPNENAKYVLKSTDLLNEFITSPTDSEKKYLNNTIEVHGIITELNDYDLTLDDKIFCQFSFKIKVDSTSIKIKGRFIGYDDLLEQLKLDQCTILTN